MKEASLREIWLNVKSHKMFAMSLHLEPDVDSYGACLAMKYVLERNGKKAILVSPDRLPAILDKLPWSEEVQFGGEIEDVGRQEAYILLDFPILAGFSRKEGFKLGEIPAYVIDHHSVREDYGSLRCTDCKQPSTCSLLVDLFRENGMQFDGELATRLLLGVCTDSGFFTYDTNPGKALEDAAFLIKQGAKYLEGILMNVYYRQSLKYKQYFAKIIQNLKFNEKYKCEYSSIFLDEIAKLGLNEADVRGGISDLQFIDGFDFVFTLAEMNDYIKGSFRSKKRVDVSRFANVLKGGRHKQAASFILKKCLLMKPRKKF